MDDSKRAALEDFADANEKEEPAVFVGRKDIFNSATRILTRIHRKGPALPGATMSSKGHRQKFDPFDVRPRAGTAAASRNTQNPFPALGDPR